MTTAEYRAVMKEAKKEFNDWLKENKKVRLRVKREAAKIRKATLTARAKPKKRKSK